MQCYESRNHTPFSSNFSSTATSITLFFDQMQWSKEEEDKFKSKVVEGYDREASPYFSTARLWDDGIIHPSDTRKVIGLCLSASIKPHPEDTKYGVFRM